MSIVLLGRKKGMARVFNDNGDMVPVSIIELSPGMVVTKKTKEKDGYEALQLGFEEGKENKIKKPVLGQFKKAGVAPKKYIRESKVDKSTFDKYNTGDSIDITYFSKDDFVDISGTSIGKGFAGGVKRWHYRGGDDSHGSMFHRAPGSIGASAFPSRVLKGTKLPGHMGNQRVTVQNVKVISVRNDESVILVKGAVPGPKGCLVEVRKAKKKVSAGK